ncbi:hypothetical protein PG995_006778 [Apiospora arundinis]
MVKISVLALSRFRSASLMMERVCHILHKVRTYGDEIKPLKHMCLCRRRPVQAAHQIPVLPHRNVAAVGFADPVWDAPLIVPFESVEHCDGLGGSAIIADVVMELCQYSGRLRRCFEKRCNLKVRHILRLAHARVYYLGQSAYGAYDHSWDEWVKSVCEDRPQDQGLEQGPGEL